ncbi:MAG: ATP-binding protein [Candidatus Omnitrophica bacterium]|nr:ATP-binding protein [Candidatus Omnitrophota bacterium]
MKISEILSSKIDLVPDCVARFVEKIKDLAFSSAQLFQIKLCLEEAIANAVCHGNQLNLELPVEISLRVNQDSLEIDVVSQGEGFDFRKVDDPTKDKNMAKLNGRGIFLIKKNMDQVSFFDEGRGIKMIKFFQKAA